MIDIDTVKFFEKGRIFSVCCVAFMCRPFYDDSVLGPPRGQTVALPLI